MSLAKTLLTALPILLAFSLHASAHDVAQNVPDDAAATDKAGAAPSTSLDKTVKSDIGAVKVANVFFKSPKNGAKVKKTFTAKFGVEGMKVANAGEIVEGTGHFHVMIDAPAVKEGEVVPADKTHLHFGKGQTEAKLTLPKGKHTLVLQFADGYHRAFGPELTQEIKITVK